MCFFLCLALRRGFLFLILAKGCKKTKSEKCKGVLILSVPTVGHSQPEQVTWVRWTKGKDTLKGVYTCIGSQYYWLSELFQVSAL